MPRPYRFEADVTTFDDGPTSGDVFSALADRLALLVVAPLAVGALAFGITTLITPTFTARTSFMPPQQSQNASALGALGSLAQLAGGTVGVKSSADQMVALMQSVTVSDRLVDRFKLMDTYDVKFRVDARNKLADRVRLVVGKKDGMVSVEVDDTSPQRAADIANRYIEELRLMTDTLAVTEAQQRREFFDDLLRKTQAKLVTAQQTLQASGFNPGALKVEPKAAAEAYATLKAEATAAEVRLQTLRGSLSDSTPEVRQQQARLAALRDQLARSERPTTASGGPDYVSKYREFKYQETLFELYARQLELARVDESREGGLIQVVDKAMPPEKKSKPRRGLIAASAAVATLAALAGWIAWRAPRRRQGTRHVPERAMATRDPGDPSSDGPRPDRTAT